mmetsp:Transcript_9841/g.14392  ORF Transcript_9841/g.14392 Transcript_9841/m.14392 type:complete len:83 (-) Transcript_9841:811-1059(-)
MFPKDTIHTSKLQYHYDCFKSKIVWDQILILQKMIALLLSRKWDNGNVCIHHSKVQKTLSVNIFDVVGWSLEPTRMSRYRKT